MPTQTAPSPTLPAVGDLKELASLVKHRGTLHVRFSEGPEEDERRGSIDAESGLRMPGLAAYPLSPPEWWKRPLEDWLARQLSQFVDLTDSDSRAWLLVGTEMGEGPDREALLGHVRPMGWISDELLAEARSRYEERFAPRSRR
jgi:hypothetical protein